MIDICAVARCIRIRSPRNRTFHVRVARRIVFAATLLVAAALTTETVVDAGLIGCR